MCAIPTLPLSFAECDRSVFHTYAMSLATASAPSIFELVTRASQCLINSDPRAAQGHLDAIKETLPILLQELKRREKELNHRQEELMREEASVIRQINSKEIEKNAQRKKIETIEENKARNEALLDDARSDLREEESKKNKAESDRNQAVGVAVGGGIGTAAVGVGAVVLGVLFPPTLLGTVPAIAVTTTITAACANDAVTSNEKIRNCSEKISQAEQDIERQERQIRTANDRIGDIERDISALTYRQQSLYAELGQMRNTITFLQQAITYFGQLKVAVEGGQQRTSLLRRMVDQINEKQKYTILDSRGGTTVLNSFSEAWNRVENEVIKGDKAGYLRIDFEDIPERLKY